MRTMLLFLHYLQFFALQQYLVQTKKRTSMAVILESGEPRDVHHLRLFLDMVLLQLTHILHRRVFRSLSTLICLTRIIMRQLMITIRQLSQVLLRFFAKMGISTIQSYQGAKIFEAIGINSDVIDKYFKGFSFKN